MAVFVDTFTEPSADTALNSHTPNTGTSWSLLWQAGASSFIEAKTATGVAQADASVNNGGCIYTADGTYPSADYETEATLTLSTGARPIYLLVRVQDQENMYAVRVAGGTNNARLAKKVGGTWTPLGTAFTVASGSVVKLRIVGTTLTVFDDGAQADSVTVSDIAAAGKAGIAMGGGGELVTSTDDLNTAVDIDNLTVTNLGSAFKPYVAAALRNSRLVGV